MLGPKRGMGHEVPEHCMLGYPSKLPEAQVVWASNVLGVLCTCVAAARAAVRANQRCPGVQRAAAALGRTGGADAGYDTQAG